MRLTLRTLLAWLDDTLSPAEVRQIGQQVAESPFAQELVEKIHRVTRQRRLTVPGSNGPEATDPNLVADYLDNALNPDDVAEFEKRCLTSDVHLAEVASAHQILSLIGQRAKVPDEARHRMYHLIKGRETVGAPAPRVFKPRADDPDDGPVAPWSAPELARRPWFERFGPAVAVVGLIAVLGISAYRSIGPGTEGTAVALNNPLPPPKPKTPPILPVPVVAPPPVQPDLRELPPEEDDANMPDEGKDAAKGKEKGEDRPVEPAPAKGVGTLGKTDGILLRYNDAATALRWEVVPASGALRADDRLVGLAPYRVPLAFGPARIELVRGAEVRPRAPEAETAATFDLARGQVVAQVEERGTRIGVGFNGRTLTIAPGVGVPIGLERLDRREPGEAEPLPVLAIFVPEGEATFTAGNAKETVTGPAVLQFRPPALLRDKEPTPIPAWVTETAPSALDQQVGKQFADLFAPGKYPSTVLNEAVSEDQKDLQRLAIQGLGSIEDYGYLAEILGTPNNPTARRAAIAELRSGLGQSSEKARKIREAFQAYQTPEWSRLVEKLLVGYSTKEAKADETYSHLVKELESSDVGIRELALENLRALTGRDRLDYNPDKPDDGDGLKAWKDLLKEKKLKTQAPARPK